MPLQDLTPQLRTRLSRVERAVGLFITLATLLLLGGFAYYIYHTAERKGWFLTKIFYSTSLNNAAGLKLGDPIKLMGFNVGEVTEIQANDPGAYFGVTVSFRIKDPYFGYIWLDSKVRVAPSDFLGNRYLEIITGKYLEPTVRTNLGAGFFVLNSGLVKTNFDLFKEEIRAEYVAAAKANKEELNISEHMLQIDTTNRLNAAVIKQPAMYYTNLANAGPYWIEPLESPALADRLEALVNTVETALPGILNLTNQINGALTNAGNAAALAQSTLNNAQPILANLTVITSTLTNSHGSLGEWLLPTNLNAQLQQTLQSAQLTLTNANGTLASADTNLTDIATRLDLTLINLASITSNLNAQVQANTNLLAGISAAIIHSDELVQGLKKHWLLRSAFKTNKTAVVKSISPKTR